MHLKVSFISKNGAVRLPIHYNRAVQGAIYNSISPDLAEFLHNKGFCYEKRSFKMFSFSRLLGKSYLDRGKGQFVFPEGFKLIISSPLEPFCVELGNILMFSEQVNFNESIVCVDKMEVQEYKVEGDQARFRVLSPVVAYSTLLKPEGGKYTCYYQPGEKQFEEQLGNNLRKKYVSLYQEEAPPGDVKILKYGKARQSVVKYKGFIIKGYSCNLHFSGPRELLQIALDSGLGAKNCQGFGCVEVM